MSVPASCALFKPQVLCASGFGRLGGSDNLKGRFDGSLLALLPVGMQLAPTFMVDGLQYEQQYDCVPALLARLSEVGIAAERRDSGVCLPRCDF